MEDMEQKGTGSGAADSLLTKDEIDTIGEILNISMGSASTALSALLDKQVVITPPKVSLEMLSTLDYAELEPAILVKIQYIEGISGSNIMLFRQHDMQIILNLLMGTDDPPRDDFEFDELSMSAACEVMNQMMGASATALSEVLSTPVNISTPDAYVVSDQPLESFVDVPQNEKVVAISFGMSIKDVMSTSFASIMTSELAQMIIKQVMGDQSEAAPAPPPSAPAAQAPAPSVPPVSAPAAQAPPPAAAPPPMPQPTAPPPAAPTYQPPAAPAAQPAAALPMEQQPMMNPYMGMPQMPGYPPYPYPYPMPQMPTAPPQQQQPEPGMYTEMGVIKQPVNVQSAQFPNFSVQAAPVAYSSTNSSMDLLMNVPLNVSVEIGKTKRKIKEIMEFGQGTVIELDKQAGAPVEIVVNGQPIARGDVVVIEDNFGVRITEILGMKDLMESLGNGNKM